MRTGLALLALAACGHAVPYTDRPLHATQVATSSTHTCARMSDDTMRCWGGNDWGGLGAGDTTGHFVVAPPLGGVAEVAVGYGFTCARTRDGTVTCFGEDLEGEVGVPPPADEYANHSVPALTHVPGLTDVVQIGAGDKLACALRADGTVWCWGDNANGQLGDGTTTARDGPVQVKGLDDVTAISVGDAICAIRADRTLWCWGLNTTEVPTQVPGLAGVVEVAAGGLVTCARDDRDVVRCWGPDDSGQLARGDDRDGDDHGIVVAPGAPVAGLSGARALAVSSYLGCAIAGERVECWGAAWANPKFPRRCLRETSHSEGGGGDDEGGGDADQWDFCAVPTPVPDVVAPISISVSDRGACAIAEAGVQCWGDKGAETVPL